MLDAYIYDGLRTPIGRHAGALAGVRPDDMVAGLIRALVARNPVSPSEIEDVLLGCACQAGEDGRNIGRHAGLLAGLPVGTAGATINRLCGSGMNAVIDACRAASLGEGELFVAGGVESMTRAPLVMAKAETAYSREIKVFDTTIGARFANPLLVAEHGNHSMPETADNVADDLGIGREESDRFAWMSQQKYARAKAAGFFDGEILPVEVPSRNRKAPPTVVAEDEHPRPETTLEQLAKLKPLAEGGVVTAGNSSGINDGAAALLIGSRRIGLANGMKPLARVRAAAIAGVPPRIMGLGPVPASRKALERAGLTLADMDVIEINEAFAVQVLGCCRELDLDPEDPRLNPNGGAVALGHPLGASGARLMLTAARQMRRQGGRFALATMCIGVGQGIAAVLEAV
ncbi:MAG: 3-oxoadipyl-CoA thiolase [Solirubrobacterales bacterium]